MIRYEQSRFNGQLKRVDIISARPTLEQLTELQTYYNSSECTHWESETIRYTFRTMQLLGYQVRLFRTKKGKDVDVDLANVYVKPNKDLKKEINRNRKYKPKEDNENNDDEEEVK